MLWYVWTVLQRSWIAVWDRIGRIADHGWIVLVGPGNGHAHVLIRWRVPWLREGLMRIWMLVALVVLRWM